MIDAMRHHFGVDHVNPMLRKSMKAEPGYFYAVESGMRSGAPDLRSRWAIMQDKKGISYSIESDWMFIARCIATARGIVLPRMDVSSGDSDVQYIAIDRANHVIADQARKIYLSATDEEMFSASMIRRDDYK